MPEIRFLSIRHNAHLGLAHYLKARRFPLFFYIFGLMCLDCNAIQIVVEMEMSANLTELRNH